MKILIRQGSAAKNFDTLISLVEEFPDKVMFCSDDKHPDELLWGHIDCMVRQALSLEIDPFKVLRAVSLIPVRHYDLDVGLLQIGNSADFLEVSDLKELRVLNTYIRGKQVAHEGQSLLEFSPPEVVNKFNCRLIKSKDLEIEAKRDHIRVIRALEGQLITKEFITTTPMRDGKAVSDTSKDLLKLVVVNRYKNSTPSIAFVTGIGLTEGAFASSVAHDCHNIIAAGVNDADIAEAINLIVEHRGGLSIADNGNTMVLPLPIAGLMSTFDGFSIAKNYESLERKVKKNGSNLSSPYMTLSFLALLVIPELKLSDRGLFSGEHFKHVNLFV